MKKAGIILSVTGFIIAASASILFATHLINAFTFYMGLLTGLIFLPFGLSFLVYDKPEEKRKKIAKVAFAVACMLLVGGSFSSSYEVPGARIEVIIATVIFSFFYGSITFKNKYETWKIYARSKRDAFVLSSFDFIGVGCVMLGILFNIQNWPGQRLLFVIGALGIFLGIVFWKRILKREVFFRKEAEDKVKESLEKIEQSHKEIRDSINYARRLQDAILPSGDYFQKHFPESFILYKPKDIVAGDFYWMEVIGNLTLVAVADCTGHGVPGAMVSVVCNNALNRTVNEFGLKDPGKILDKVNGLVLETFNKSNDEVKDGMDISLLSLESGVGSSEKRIVKWSGANNPLWVVKKNNLIEFKADKQPIGQHDNRKPFTNHEVEIEKGDSVYLFTDGYADQFGGPKGKKFKYKQISDKLVSIQEKSMSQQKTILAETLENWKGNLEQVDDICIIGIRF